MNSTTPSDSGPLYAGIGQQIESICGSKANKYNKIFAYVEAGDGWMGASIYKELPDYVEYFFPNKQLNNLLYEAWEAEPANKRWAAMEYETDGNSFTASFKFADQLDQNEFSTDRRTGILKARYGDKPIHYPPL